MALALSNYFLAPSLAVWFWLLVPFILLYLIKPKPMDQTIPSLMFLMQDKGKAFRNSFLRYLYRDFVFFLQFLILALLVAAAAQPFVTVPKTSLVTHAVIVLDNSASMAAEDGRWEDALDEARARLSWQNTLILVRNRPVVLGSEITKGEAEELLANLEPAHTETNLYSAIVAAREYAPNADTSVTVISDFRNTDAQQDYRAAIRTVEASGAAVETVQVGGAARNIGITAMDAQEDKTVVFITNFNNESSVVTLTAGSLKQDVPLGPQATEPVTIATPPGITEIAIDADDDFPLDDTATLVNNEDLSVSMLIVTNNENIGRTPFWYSIQAINEQTPLEISVDINTPPSLTTVDHDIVVFADVSPNLLVQRTVRDAASSVESGNAAIILYQHELFGIDFEGMLPLSYEGQGGSTGVVAGELSPITKDVDFGEVQRYHRASGNVRALAEATADNSPVIALLPFGEGQVLYYGIDDSTAGFPQEPYYPVFWKRALDQLGGRVSLERLNYKTGAVPVGVSGEPEELPDGPDEFSGFLDQQGVYRFGDRAVAANLLSADESRISAEPLESRDRAGTGESSVAMKEKELSMFLAILVLILLFLELFIVKFRGDF